MNKEYKAVQQLLGVPALVADKDNGAYFVEDMMDSLEEGITNLNQRSATLDAKLEEIKQLNETINNLRDEKAALDNSIAEKDATIASINEQVTTLTEQVSNLTNDTEGKDSTITEKDNAIAALNDKVAELQQTITEKDAEIASLGHKAPEQPASQAGQEGKADEKDLSAHNVTHDGMTLKEETEALKARYNQLCGLA